MRLFATCRRGAQVSGLCGLLFVLAIMTGCGPKAAPPAPAKSATGTLKTNLETVVQTNLSDQYTSVFEDLPPPKGKDPFFPTSHRRDAAMPTATVGAAVDPVLVLKAIIHTSKHSQAVINNVIFEEGEEESVRVPDGKVRVRCIKIGGDYILIQVQGEGEPKRLMMEQKK